MGNLAGVRRDFDALEKRRLRGARLLEKGVPPCEVARLLGVNRQSVYQWERTLKESGRAGLKKAGRAGRKPKLSHEEQQELISVLKAGAEKVGYETRLWTIRRVAEVIAERFGVSYDPSQVWRILRGIGWSCQRPTGRALERDEQAITRWKRERWPEVKKTPKPSARRSSSSTRAG
jgi:transposase